MVPYISPGCGWLVKDNLFHFQVLISGPSGSPYEGGSFQVDLSFSDKYPFEPPTIEFKTQNTTQASHGNRQMREMGSIEDRYA
jgi:ubiquitin-protein ligase